MTPKDMNTAKPRHLVEWREEDNIVSLKVRKFNGRFGKWFCTVFKRSNYFYYNLDRKGSFIWKQIDSIRSTEDILLLFWNAFGEEVIGNLEKKYGQDQIKDLYDKHGHDLVKADAISFLKWLKRYGYIEFIDE